MAAFWHLDSSSSGEEGQASGTNDTSLTPNVTVTVACLNAQAATALPEQAEHLVSRLLDISMFCGSHSHCWSYLRWGLRFLAPSF